MLATGDFGVLRAKGFVTDGAGVSHLIQVVGSRHSVDDGPKHRPTGIVCIGLAGMLNQDGLLAMVGNS